MKDYIYIYDSNNNKLKMEVVLKFNIDGYKSNYIIYRDNKDYFVAKYIGDNIVDLDTDLSETEIKFCKKMLERFMKNGTESK